MADRQHHYLLPAVPEGMVKLQLMKRLAGREGMAYPSSVPAERPVLQPVQLLDQYG